MTKILLNTSVYGRVADLLQAREVATFDMLVFFTVMGSHDPRAPADGPRIGELAKRLGRQHSQVSRSVHKWVRLGYFFFNRDHRVIVSTDVVRPLPASSPFAQDAQ